MNTCVLYNLLYGGRLPHPRLRKILHSLVRLSSQGLSYYVADASTIFWHIATRRRCTLCSLVGRLRVRTYEGRTNHRQAQRNVPGVTWRHVGEGRSYLMHGKFTCRDRGGGFLNLGLGLLLRREKSILFFLVPQILNC